MDKYNILVCDDDKAIVDALEIYLKQEGTMLLRHIQETGIESFGGREDPFGFDGCDDAGIGRPVCNRKNPGRTEHTYNNSVCKI